MEIGSFIELDIPDNGEYFQQDNDLARLNAARTGIFHALRLLNCSTIYLPYYLCSSVRDFLIRKGIKIYYYNLTNKFEPIVDKQEPETAILIVNYFGILSHSYLTKISSKYKNVIIDNCPAFYNLPIEGYFNVYSPRKFFGVPDGCYVVGKNAKQFVEEYQKDYSSGTSAFLLKRIESGSSATYAERMLNETRINTSDILQMSALTQVLLGGIDYERIRAKRKENFDFAHKLYKSFNLLDLDYFNDSSSIPMVYPLVIEDLNLVKTLTDKNIYTGRWWNHVLKELPDNTFEAWLSSYMVPIPIDQRYGEKQIELVYNEIRESLS